MEIFITVPRADYLKFFYDDQGNLDGKQLADFLGLNRSDLAVFTGGNVESIRFDERMSVELKEKLLKVANICELVAQYFNGNQAKIKTWFLIPNPTLENRRPIDLIKGGEVEKLEALILKCLNFQSKDV